MREVLFVVRRYGPATVFTTIALILTLVLSGYAPSYDRFPYVLLAGAVIASALQGGFKPGLFATGLAVAAMTLRYLIFPNTEPSSTLGDFVAQMGLAIFVGLLASYVGEHCWRAVRATEWLETALGSAGEGVIFTDGDGKISFMNGLAQELTGWGQEIVGHKNLEAVFRIVDGDTRMGLPSPLERAVQSRAATRIPDPTLLLARGDKERPVMGCLTPIVGRDGTVDGTVLVFRDVTQAHQVDEEQRRHAERCQAIVASLPVGMIMMDPQGRCLEVNRAASGICGTSPQESLGEGWIRNVHPQERETLVVDWTEAIHKSAEFTREVQFVTPQGPRVVLLRAAPVSTEKGIHLGHAGILQDVKDYKEREEALTRAHETACRQTAEFKKQLDKLTGQVGEVEKQAQERAQLLQRLQERETELTRLRAEMETAKKNYDEQLRQHGQTLGDTRKALQDAETALQKKLQEQSADLTAAQATLKKKLEEAQQREKKAHKQLEEALRTGQQGSAEKLAELTHERERLRQELDLAVERELRAEEALARERPSLERQVELERENERIQRVHAQAVQDHEAYVKPLQERLGQLESEHANLSRLHAQAVEGHEARVKPLQERLSQLEAENERLSQLHAQAVHGHESHHKPLQERMAQVESENQRLSRLHSEAVNNHELRMKPLRERLTQLEAENERLRWAHADAEARHKAEPTPDRQRWQWQQQWEAAEARLQHVVEAVDAVLWEADANSGELDAVTRTAEKMLGFPVRSWHERGSFATAFLHPDDQLRATAWYHRVAQEGITAEFECQAVATGDRTVWVRMHAAPVRNDKGMITRVRGVMVDISRRKQIEQRLSQVELRLREHLQQTEQHRLVETRLQQEVREARQAADQHFRHGKLHRSLASSLGMALIAVDRDGGVVFMNPAAERLLGWKESEVHGRNIQGWLLFPSTEDQAARTERTGHVVRQEEVFARRDGGMLRVRCTESPWFVEGHIEGTVIAFGLRPETTAPAEPWRSHAAHSSVVVSLRTPEEETVVAVQPTRGRLLKDDAWIDYN